MPKHVAVLCNNIVTEAIPLCDETSVYISCQTQQ